MFTAYYLQAMKAPVRAKFLIDTHSQTATIEYQGRYVTAAGVVDWGPTKLPLPPTTKTLPEARNEWRSLVHAGWVQA